MSQQRYCTVAKLGITAALLTLTSVGMCQAESVEQAAPVVVIDSIDEIIVYGENSLHLLREDVIQAEEQVFTVFNAINSNDEFDIHCVEEARTGTRIKSRLCRPNFVTQLTKDPKHHAWLFPGRTFGPYIPDWVGVNEKHRLLQEEMEALSADHPELLDALVDYAVKKHVLASEKQNQCRGKGIICEE